MCTKPFAKEGSRPNDGSGSNCLMCSFLSEVQRLYSTSVYTEPSTWTFPSIQSRSLYKRNELKQTICTKKKNACHNVTVFSVQFHVYWRHEFSSVSPLCHSLKGHRAVFCRLISKRCGPMWRLLSGRPWLLPRHSVLRVLPPTGAQSPLELGFQGSCAQSSESHLELLSQRKQEK